MSLLPYKYTKNFKFGTKNAMCGYFRHMLRPEVVKAIIIYQINTLKFIKIQGFMQKEKTSNLGLRTPYLCIFSLQF